MRADFGSVARTHTHTKRLQPRQRKSEPAKQPKHKKTIAKTSGVLDAFEEQAFGWKANGQGNKCPMLVFHTVEVSLSQPCFDHFFRPCFKGHDEAGLLAFEALRGSPRPARGQASDAKRNGTMTKRGSRGLESI